MRPPQEPERHAALPLTPTGSWRSRVLAALQLAWQNWQLRRDELPPLGNHIHDDIDRLLPPRCDRRHAPPPCADGLCHRRLAGRFPRG